MEIDQHLMSPLPGCRIVKIPLEIFLSQRILTLSQLHNRLVSLKCIQNWFLMGCSSQMVTSIQLMRVSGHDVMTMDICDSLRWSLSIAGNCVPSSSLVFKSVPSIVTSLDGLKEIVIYIDRCTVCKGNADPRFMPLVNKCKGVFKDRSGK